MGFNLRGDKSSLALLSSKRVKAYSRTKADEAFALPSFSDAAPAPPVEPPRPPVGPRRTTNAAANTEHRAEQDSDNVKQTMLQHESVFKEQLHELHRLYQKQCMLMAESQKGHACHPPSGPPSSNSSLLYNSDSFKPQEDRSFGDASVSKPFDKNQNLNAFPAQVENVKPFEADAERKKQGCDRPMLDLERPTEGRPLLDLERPADDLPCFDLERPPVEEYMDAELGKEKTQVTGLTCTLLDASVLSNRQSVKENRDFITGESLMPGKDKESWRSKKLAVCPGYDCKEGIFEGYSQHGGLGLQPTACKEDYSSPIGSFTKALDYSCQYSFSHPVEAVSASGSFRELPDLNGELSSAENQTFHLQIRPDKRVNDRQYIDLEADSRLPNGTSSKLPHWLVQPPPKALRMSVPTNCSDQTSEWQQKTTFFSPQVHAQPKSLVVCTPSPGEMMKASASQEPYHPWSYINTPPQQREISFKEPLSFPSQFYSGENAGAAQGPYGVAHVSGLANESIPYFLPYVRDNAKMSVSFPLQNSPLIEGKERSLASRVSASMDRQDIVFDAHAASMELLSRISSKTPTPMSPVLPWYQQKESFSSLLHQASNPEPPFYRASYVPSVDPWEPSARHQALTISGGVNTMERDVDRMHSVVSNTKGQCLMPKTESHTKGPVFDFLPSSTEKAMVTQELSFKGIEATNTWKQVEKPFYIGQIAEKAISADDHSIIPRRNVFDLNMSCESLPSEENLDPHHFTEGRFFHAKQIQVLKQECETISSSDWDMPRGNKAPSFNAQQKGSEPQAIGFADRTANQLMGFDLSSKDAAQSPNDGTLFPRAGMLHSQRHRLANDTCAGYCSGEDETGGGFVEVKSSDASGLTSCESRDAAHLESAKARDDSNTSSGEACQSRESGVPHHKEDVALSSNVQSKRTSVLPLAKANGLAGSQQWDSFFLSTMQSGLGLTTKGDCSTLICTEFGDESEAANSIARKHAVETADAAEVLLSLGLEVPPVAEEGYAIGGNNEKALDWLANIIPQEENCEAQVLGVDMAGMAMHTDISTQPATMDVAEKIMDPFESAVLALQPIDPDVESLAVQTMDGASLTENCCSLPSLRRRPSRRGRAGKDFQREMLRSITPLSRQEISEDFQIIEGLIYSTTEAMNISSLFPEDKPMSSPDSGSQKKVRGTKACRGRKLSGNLNVCSWGESSRRKRMGRQRSQWSCLPPRVECSPFINNTGDGGLFM